MTVDLFTWFSTQNPNDSNVLLSLTEGVKLDAGKTVNTYNNNDVILGAGENGDNGRFGGEAGWRPLKWCNSPGTPTPA
jgi:hypothetical protein